MPYNGSGSFSLAGNDAVANSLIESANRNTRDSDIATGLSTALCRDGQSTVTANIPMGGFKLTGVGAATARTDAATLANIQDGTGVYVATVGGTADVITLTPSPAITAYAAGQTFRFIASGANTTNVTVNISGLGAKAITKNGTTALVAGDIPSGAMVTITYDGTRFILGAVTREFLPITGGTLTGNLLFTDATYDIGASGATRPRDFFLSRNATIGGTLGVTGTTTLSGAVSGQGNVIGNLALGGHLYGLTLSNNGSDATNDIDIAAGSAVSGDSASTSRRLMILASGLTKQLDAAWAVGTNAGMLDTGTIANGTYHIFLIMRSDTGVVDVLASTSATAPTMPTNYDFKRRIGSILRESAAIVGFVQDGDLFQRKTSIMDHSEVANPGDSLRTLSVPTGLVIKAKMNVGVRTANGGTPSAVNVLDPAVNDDTPTTGAGLNIATVTSSLNASGSSHQHSVPVLCRTNTSAQCRFNVASSDANVFLSVETLGWEDSRGREN